MSILFKQLFIALLSFNGSLATKCVLLSNETGMIKSIFISLNPAKLNCYPFMIRLEKCR